MTTVTTTDNKAVATQPTQLKPWQQALVSAEGKFLAIADKVRTKQELGFASQIIQGSEALQKCTPDSIISAVINVARTGITLNPILRLAYLIPRKGKATLDFDYKGLVKVLKDNGCVKYLDSFIVYEDEDFDQNPSQINTIHHVIKYAKTEEEQKKRPMKGVYCRVVLPDGYLLFTQLTPMWRINKSRDVAQTKVIWDAWLEDMIMKTKIKLDWKLLISGEPSDKLSNVLQLEEENNPVNLPSTRRATIASTFSSEAETQEAEVIIEEVDQTAPTYTYEAEKTIDLGTAVIKKGSKAKVDGDNFIFTSVQGAELSYTELEIEQNLGDGVKKINL